LRLVFFLFFWNVADWCVDSAPGLVSARPFTQYLSHGNDVQLLLFL
jgi:hypothetical protein